MKPLARGEKTTSQAYPQAGTTEAGKQFKYFGMHLNRIFCILLQHASSPSKFLIGRTKQRRRPLVRRNANPSSMAGAQIAAQQHAVYHLHQAPHAQCPHGGSFQRALTLA